MQKKVWKNLNSFLTLLIFLLLSISSFSSAYSTDQGITSKPSTLPEGIATLGGRASVDDTDGFIDVLNPIWGNEDGFLFINPRAFLAENSANEENIGLGARKLIMEDRAIVGGNIFYDNRESEYGNRFDQLGVGVELLTEWVDFRANYYLPEKDQDLIASGEIKEVQSRVVSATLDETPVPRGNAIVQEGIETIETITTTHHFDKFESAMEGIDFEVGLKIPVISKVAETRIYGGYYFYDSRFGKDLGGFKTRLEVRATPGLIMDAEWYEDRELHGSDWYVGARIRLPFEIGNIFQRKNPFEGAREYFKPSTKPLKVRMTDMVMRDIDIIREESEFIEDPLRLKIEKELTQKSFEVTLRGGIIFVDGDQGQGDGKTVLPWEGLGTFENPYTTIQAAVSAAPEDSIVYVDHAKEPYYENVKLKDGMILWGSGLKIFGFESGKYPTIDGRSRGPSVEMANKSVVMGVNVVNSDMPEGGSHQKFERTVAGATFNIQRVGVYAENKTDLVLRSNVIQGNSVGVLLVSEAGASTFTTAVEGNWIQSNNSDGVRILTNLGHANADISILNNVSSKNSFRGIDMNLTLGGHSKVTVEGNVVDENQENGILVLTRSSGSVEAHLDKNKTRNNYQEGIELDIVASKDISVFANDNEVNKNGYKYDMDNAFSGMFTNVDSQGDITIKMERNRAGENAANGIEFFMTALGRIVLQVNDNTTEANGFDQITGRRFSGIYADLDSRAGVDISFERNHAEGNSAFGIGTLLFADRQVTVSGKNNEMDRNGYSGFYASLEVDSGDVDLNIEGNTANRNGFSADDAGGIYLNLNYMGTMGGFFNATLVENHTHENATNGIFLQANALFSGDFDGDFERNEAGKNGKNGIFLDVLTANDVDVLFWENSTDRNDVNGVSVDAFSVGEGSLDALLSGNTANENHESGIGLNLAAAKDLILGLFSNTTNFNRRGSGIESSLAAGTSGVGELIVTESGNISQGNGED